MVGVSLSASLFGRDAELDELRRLVARARDGVGGIALIEGEPGIGKTSLLGAVTPHAADQGLAIIRGAANALERERPFAALIDAFGLSPSTADARVAGIGDLIYNTAPGTADTRFLVVERITDLVEERALSAPLLIAIEDLHWADPATLLVLHRLAVIAAALPLVLLGTLRPLPRSQQLSHVIERFESEGARVIELRRLSEQQVADLAAARLGAPVGPKLLAMLDGAAGNPLFVGELLGALEQEGTLKQDEGGVDVGEASLPPSVTLTILRRITYLSEDTLEMLRIASVMGATFSLTDLARVMGRPTTDLLPMINEATGLGVLGEEERAIVFRHELIRDAIYDDILSPVRTGLHHRVARALIDAGAPAMRIAPHIALGAEAGDLEAIAWLRGTASKMRSMPQIAADLLDRAAEIAGGQIDPELRLQRVEALIAAGRGGDAELAAREAVAADGTIQSRIALSKALSVAWKIRESVEEAEAVARDTAATPAQRAEMLASAAAGRSYWDRVGAERQAIEASELAQGIDAPLAKLFVAATLHLCYYRDGYVGRALSTLEDMWVSFPHALFPPPYSLLFSPERQLPAQAAMMADRFDEAERHLDSVRRSKDPPHSVSAWSHWQMAALAMWSGSWDEAIATGEAGLVLCTEAGLSHEASMIREILCYIALHRGDIHVAHEHLDVIPGAMWTRALLAEAENDPGMLAKTLDDYREAVNDPRPWMMPTMWLVGPDWVRLYVDADDLGSARILTEVVEEGARRAQTPTAEGAALRARGLLEADPELLVKAVETHGRGPRPFLTAQASEDAASALARNAGRADDAITLLRDALEMYGSVEATWDIARAESRLRGLGVRRGKGARADRPRFGWESLTDSERRVVALVPDGLTYREIGERLFISKRTVETHIAHVFTKLGVSSRRELTDHVLRHGG